jgi:hypothetical protein
MCCRFQKTHQPIHLHRAGQLKISYVYLAQAQRKFYRAVTGSVEFWGIWELDSSHGGSLFMVIFADTIFMIVRINIKKQAGIGF